MVYKFFGLPSSATLADLEEAGRQFCSTPWSSVQATRAAEIHVDRYCFRYALNPERSLLALSRVHLYIAVHHEGLFQLGFNNTRVVCCHDNKGLEFVHGPPTQNWLICRV